jgi:cold shock protein
MTKVATGTIKKWVDDRGFGFIRPESGGDDVFVHQSQFEIAGLGIPREGDRVTYEVKPDPRSGKLRAMNLARA